MSFTIKLYTFSKHENSTKQPTGGTELSCNIKTPSSLISPVAEFSLASNPIAYNYAYISEFNRYYFITDWTFNRGLWIASMVCDVLATYKSAIGGTSLFVLRSSASFNTYVRDNMYPVTGEFSETLENKGPLITASNPFTAGRYVVSVVGKNTGTSTLYEFTPSNFVAFLNKIMTVIDGFSPSDVLQALDNLLFQPMDYINSCMWFPNSFTGDTSQGSAWVGWYDTGISAKQITNPTAIAESSYLFDIVKHPQETRGKYLDLNPYSHYMLYYEPFGVINIDSSLLMNSTKLETLVTVDAMTGEAELRVRNDANDILASVKAQWGVSLNLKGNTANLGNNPVSSLAGMVGMITGGSEGATLGHLASTGIGAITGAMTGTVSNIGSTSGIMCFTRARTFVSRFYKITDEDNTNNGRPLCEIHTPSSLTGFMQVQKGEVEISGTQEEANQIRRWLESGFYYE